MPRVYWHPQLLELLLYAGLIATALAYWAMSVINRSVAALTTALGTLATPLIGIVGAAFFLGERIEITLVVAAAFIIAGTALGILARDRASAPRVPDRRSQMPV